MLNWEKVSFPVLTASGAVASLCVCMCVCLYSNKHSGCSQFSRKWWGSVRLLLVVMRLPAAPRCFTQSSSAPPRSRLVFAQHRALPLNCKCRYTHLVSRYIRMKRLLFLSSLSTPALAYSPGIAPVLFLLLAAPLSSSSLPPCQPLLCLLSAGVLCNWAVVNSTLAWITGKVTFGSRCWPLLAKVK